MALTPDQLALARSLTPDDMTLFYKTYQRANPDASGGVASDNATLRRVEYRVLRILARRLPAQIAATPVVHAMDQETADDLADFYGRPELSGWTSLFPPPVEPKNFRIGDVLEALDGPRLPALLVSASLPSGTEVSQGAIGGTSKEDTTVYAYYVMPYSVDTEEHLKAAAGAGAVADVLRTVRQAGGLWTNGQVGQVQVNAPLTAKGPRFIVGIVPFSCTAFVPYTPTRQ